MGSMAEELDWASEAVLQRKRGIEEVRREERYGVRKEVIEMQR